MADLHVENKGQVATIPDISEGDISTFARSCHLSNVQVEALWDFARRCYCDGAREVLAIVAESPGRRRERELMAVPLNQIGDFK